MKKTIAFSLILLAGLLGAARAFAQPPNVIIKNVADQWLAAADEGNVILCANVSTPNFAQSSLKRTVDIKATLGSVTDRKFLQMRRIGRWVVVEYQATYSKPEILVDGKWIFWEFVATEIGNANGIFVDAFYMYRSPLSDAGLHQLLTAGGFRWNAPR